MKRIAANARYKRVPPVWRYRHILKQIIAVAQADLANLARIKLDNKNLRACVRLICRHLRKAVGDDGAPAVGR